VTISNRYIRGVAAFTLALAVALIALIVLGFFVPGMVMEVIWGPWQRQPVGSGLILGLFTFFVGLPCSLVAMWVLTVRFYKKFQGRHCEKPIIGNV
jgi:hypothetical protein